MSRKPASIAISGPRVAAARRAAALTQAEAAARAGTTLSNVKRIEQRETAGVFASTLRALADTLGVQPNALAANAASAVAVAPTVPTELTLSAVLAWLDRQRLDVVGEVLEHAGSLLDLAASANGRRQPRPSGDRKKLPPRRHG